jgi:hypothetical protein
MSGPMFLQNCVSQYNRQRDQTEPSRVLVLDKQYFPSGKEREISGDKYVFGYHHFAKSWSNNKRLWMDGVRIALLSIIIIIVILIIIQTRNTKALCKR